MDRDDVLRGRPDPTDGTLATDQPRKFGVQFGEQSSRIFVGQINKAQNALLSGKEDATGMALRAVAKYVLWAHDGAMEVGYQDGTAYRIAVIQIGRLEDGTRIGLHPDGTIVGFD